MEISVAKRGVFARLVRGIVLLAVLLAVAVLAVAYSAGAWHVLFPSSDHDTREPYLPPNLRSPAILVFSKTNRFRHEDGITAGSEALNELAVGNGWNIVGNDKNIGHVDAEKVGQKEVADLGELEVLVRIIAVQFKTPWSIGENVLFPIAIVIPE